MKLKNKKCDTIINVNPTKYCDKSAVEKHYTSYYCKEHCANGELVYKDTPIPNLKGR